MLVKETEAEQIGGDARVADVKAGSLNVTASQGGAPDRRLGVGRNRACLARGGTQISQLGVGVDGLSLARCAGRWKSGSGGRACGAKGPDVAFEVTCAVAAHPARPVVGLVQQLSAGSCRLLVVGADGGGGPALAGVAAVRSAGRSDSISTMPLQRGRRVLDLPARVLADDARL